MAKRSLENQELHEDFLRLVKEIDRMLGGEAERPKLVDVAGTIQLMLNGTVPWPNQKDIEINAVNGAMHAIAPSTETMFTLDESKIITKYLNRLWVYIEEMKDEKHEPLKGRDLYRAYDHFNAVTYHSEEYENTSLFFRMLHKCIEGGNSITVEKVTGLSESYTRVPKPKWSR